ncbi:Sugar kinase of the NBD/HSP70 family, may contain an N-terminal HTH domain [Actinacidiphila yanglinensis]|uniref:Sugar kinase of the NBD/HSP70 family, may contain an N-terminal HTH domain n=1 Tax=Actinacidiphila yanglinensis TaxID=310779 RepID=A0A1H5X4E3_9ACTN|nr:Sugar kinase of the NBD/HSP70 family, may contain an N-terminal HTH domain [Actinacidiphila yanglinensis]
MDVLREWAGGGGPLAVRARVVLLATQGLRDAEIARRLGVSRQTVGTWRHRWQSAGLAGLEQRPRTGRPATVDEAEVVARALLAPGGSGASRAIARELGLSHATVASIRRRWALGGDVTRGARVPTRPPLPGADVWVMGVYVDERRAVLLAGTRPDTPPPAAVATVLGEDVLSGLAGAMDALRPGGPVAPPEDGPAAGPDPELARYLAEATAHHPDIALHAVTLWDGGLVEAAPAGPVPGGVTAHRLPANASWRSFLRAMAALDSTSHPESSRRVYLDLVAALGRGAAPVRWLRENVAGHLRSSVPAPPVTANPSHPSHPSNSANPAANPAAGTANPANPAGTSGTSVPAEPIASSGVNQIDLGSFNECVVIESVRLSGTITRGEIAHRTGLTQQSVSRIARSLIDRGILVEDAQRRATSGKPRTPVRLCGSAAHALGLHIDPEVLTAVVIDLDGAIVCTCTRPVGADTDPAEFVAQVVALGREALEKAQGSVPEDGFLGIGVAVPGPVDIASGTVLGPPLMSAWNDIPLLYLLKDHFPCPVIIEKDSLAAAAGERWIGRDRRARDFAYLYLGTGVGSGLYLNGDLYRGVSANAGEFGQLCAISLGRTGPDGRPEMVPECNPPASVPEFAARNGFPGSGAAAGSTAAYREVGRAAAAGDAFAAAALREVAGAVGRGALGLVDLLDIDLIVLGGPFFTEDTAGFYLDEIHRVVNDFPTARRLRRVEVEPSVLSAEAAAVGAASTIFHATFTPRLRTRARA